MNDTCEILYATPSFTEGIGRILDFGNTLTEYNTSNSSEQADFLALRADWRAVAADLRGTMVEADSEIQEQSPHK